MCGLGPLDQLTARESRSILASVLGRVILNPMAALPFVMTTSESDSFANDSTLVPVVLVRLIDRLAVMMTSEHR
jgi:hypothetical protein